MSPMYGSIRKSYGAKASNTNERKEQKSIFSKKTSHKELKNGEYQDTSYINVDNRKSNKNVRANIEKPVYNTENNAQKSEFPIASVILTIVFTMMVMVLAFGFGG
jgi:hypothetical protein